DLVELAPDRLPVVLQEAGPGQVGRVEERGRRDQRSPHDEPLQQLQKPRADLIEQVEGTVPHGAHVATGPASRGRRRWRRLAAPPGGARAPPSSLAARPRAAETPEWQPAVGRSGPGRTPRHWDRWL